MAWLKFHESLHCNCQNESTTIGAHSGSSIPPCPVKLFDRLLIMAALNAGFDSVLDGDPTSKVVLSVFKTDSALPPFGAVDSVFDGDSAAKVVSSVIKTDSVLPPFGAGFNRMDCFDVLLSAALSAIRIRMVSPLSIAPMNAFDV